jgi:hypothetical protein
MKGSVKLLPPRNRPQCTFYTSAHTLLSGRLDKNDNELHLRIVYVVRLMIRTPYHQKVAQKRQISEGFNFLHPDVLRLT